VSEAPPESAALVEEDRRRLARPTRRIPLVVEGGRGATLCDVDGRELVDLTSGWNVANTGWNHPRVNAAVARQLETGAFAPPWCSHRGRVRYARRLADWIGGDWLAWCGAGGTEAVEAALKIARRATGRHAVVGVEQAYHGGTLGSMLAGGVPGVQGVYLPGDELHRHAPMPDLVRGPTRDYGALMREVILAEPHAAAVLVEPLFTNPGVLAGPPDFYRAISEAVEATGALLIVDEVGTGYGRTGRRLGFEHTSLRPDIVVLGKAMASGAVPMSAALIRPELAGAVSGPGFSATFGWTPLACAAAEATLDVIEDERLVERAHVLGERARRTLAPLVTRCEHVAAVRGWGLEIGVELVSPDGRPAGWSTMSVLADRLLARGVFAEPSSFTSTLLIMPPLVIPEPDLERALSVVVDEVAELRVV
jgi:4-aminobutyrate aminotransferase-like enzyme